MTTPISEMSAGQAGWSWTVEPPARWLVIPSTVTEDEKDVAQWERAAAAVVRASFGPQPEGDDEPIELDDEESAALDQAAADAVANLREFADGMAPEGSRVVAAVGVLGRSPVPVLVSVRTSDPGAPDEGLMAALGATGGCPAAPPNIEHLDLPDGDGVRVTRLDVGEVSGGAWLSIALGRRSEQPSAVVDTVLVWRTQDVLLGSAMLELLDELLPAVRIIRGTR